MASITPRNNSRGEVISYRIRVQRGYAKGTKLKPYEMTYRPAPNLSDKQIQQELQRQAVLFEEECKNGMVNTNQNIKLAEFCDIYKDIKKDFLAPRTYEYYCDVIQQVIIPFFGHRKLQEIRSAHVQQFIISLKKEKPNTSPTTIRKKLAVLQSILTQAVKLDIIPTNPADSKKTTLPKAITPKVEIFSRPEAAEMLECLEKEELQYQCLVQIAIMTGCRLGELIALKFSDIDYNANKITVERCAYKCKGQPISLKPPKDYEVRTITVNDYCIQLIQLLKEEKERERARLGTAWIGDEWLFTQWNGHIMNPQTPTQWFSKFLKKNGLKHRKFHSLRHTSATLLLYGGVNLQTVRSRLGHADISTTNKYLHVIEERDMEAANVLGNMLISQHRRTDEQTKQNIIQKIG